MLLLLAWFGVLLQLPPASPDTAAAVLEAGARSPAYSSDGRIAVELRGDLWLVSPTAAGPALRLTTGSEWDGEPAWMPNGRELVFVSDRDGGVDLWRVGIREGGQAGEPERITRSAGEEGEPAVAPDGSLVFVRGRGPASDLWLRTAAGEERRLTEKLGAELSPTFSPDGQRIAYVREREGRRELRILWVDGEADSVVVDDRPVAHPAWSPDGSRIAFTTGGGQPGVWLAPPDGRYINLVSEHHAAPAWSPDGGSLLLAMLPPDEPAYNGDPNRLPDRARADLFPAAGRLWLLPVPPPPDADLAVVALDAPVDVRTFNAQVFDRVWSRIATLYYSDSEDEAARERWDALRAEYRPRALAASSPAELEEVVHAMLRERPTYEPEVRGRAAVSSAHPLATAAGLEMLRRGGNVVDAAVAVSFALGVVEPDASGVGGYGQMLVYLQGMEEPVAIEFLTRVPQAATLDNAALLENDRLPPDGPVLANVPGTVAGMYKAWEEFGSGNLEWKELIEPAIGLAEEGFVLDDAFTTTLARERERYEKYEGSRALFFPDDAALEPGDTLRNPDLGWTLRQIAEGGADAFYGGAVAERMVRDLRGHGNAMTLEDLERYYAADRTPTQTTYRGHTIYSSAPATSGGAVLSARLNLLEQFPDPRAYPDDVATLHAMIEAWKLAPSTSGKIADPGLWPVELAPFISKDTARARWQCFDPLRSSDPALFEKAEKDSPTCLQATETASGWEAEEDVHCGVPEPSSALHRCRATGTTAFVVGDGEGNLVSVTQTLGTWGGNFYVTPGLGFLYNDKLGSYPSDPDAYGARLPFARNVTIITPTLVFEGTGSQKQPRLAVGAAGNAWISAAVYEDGRGDHRWGSRSAACPRAASLSGRLRAPPGRQPRHRGPVRGSDRAGGAANAGKLRPRAPGDLAEGGAPDGVRRGGVGGRGRGARGRGSAPERGGGGGAVIGVPRLLRGWSVSGAGLLHAFFNMA